MPTSSPRSSAGSCRSSWSTAPPRPPATSSGSGSTGRSCSRRTRQPASSCEVSMSPTNDPDHAPRKPPRLRPGDTVGVPAPASSWENRSELLRGVAALESWGLQVKLADHVNDRHGYMAGRDEDRAADLHALRRDPEVRLFFKQKTAY